MKRFLLPVLAALALPTAVNAETWWLLVAGHTFESNTNWSIPFGSKDECESAGQQFQKKKWNKNLLMNPDFVCLKSSK